MRRVYQTQTTCGPFMKQINDYQIVLCVLKPVFDHLLEDHRQEKSLTFKFDASIDYVVPKDTENRRNHSSIAVDADIEVSKVLQFLEFSQKIVFSHPSNAISRGK